jgi:hypothetical protein
VGTGILSGEARSMNKREKVKLLHGPYVAPPLKRGDKATCLLRDCDVIITGMSSGRIPWPRCRAIGKRGGSGLLLAGDLERAVRCESAAAICYWWGVTEGVVWRWRLALDASGLNPEGSRRLRNRLNAELGADRRDSRLPPETVKRMRAAALADKRRPEGRWDEDGWSAEELALLGTDTDEAVAARVGRTLDAVRLKRDRLRIPPSRVWTAEELALLGTAPDEVVARGIGRSLSDVGRQRRALGILLLRRWTAEQRALLGTMPDAELAAQIGRTEEAVTRHRCLLGVPPACDRRNLPGGP